MQIEQLVLHLGADQRIERGKSLVHEHDRGIGRECAGKADALLHAAGQFARQAVGVGLQADGIERLHRALAPLIIGHAGNLEAERRVLVDSAVRQQREALEHHRHLAPPEFDQRGFAHRRDVFAVDAHSARGRLDQPVEHAQQCRFAGAGEAHQHEDLAFHDLEIGVLHCDGVTGARENLIAPEALLQQRECVLRAAAPKTL